MIPGETMRVHVQPAAVEDLLRFLTRADCEAVRVDEETVEVQVPESLDESQARMEVDLYLKAWQAANPDVEAHLLDPRMRVERPERNAD